MTRTWLPWIAGLLWGHLLGPVLGPLAAADWVTVVPRPTDRILANPGMGWQTFHHTARQDRSLPDWIPSTVHYARWGWGELEPQQHRLNEELLDNVLRDTRASGQKLALRVMCCSSTPDEPYHPAWLRPLGGRLIQTHYGDGPPLELPDLDDPRILGAHLDFIRRLGARYDGHPDIDHIDLGSVGWWGEWHMSEARNAQMPTAETQQQIVEAYHAAFRQTPVLMLIGGGPMFRRAVELGMGCAPTAWATWADSRRPGATCAMPIRWNCLQRMRSMRGRPRPSHGKPVGTCGRGSRKAGRCATSSITRLRCTAHTVNNKSAPLPPGAEVRRELERFLRRLGYRLVLVELRHPAQVPPGGVLDVEMKWQNVGSAPCYRPYCVAYRLANERGDAELFVSDVRVNRWWPGSIELFTEEFLREPGDLPAGEVVPVTDQIRLPADLPPGRYRLSLAIVDPASRQPVVQLGIEGRADDGWYPLSTLNVTR